MRCLPVLILGIGLCGCGSQSNHSQVLSVGSNQTPQATIEPADSLAAEDVGATVVGSAINVPAYQELQIATVVIRDSAFSTTDSFGYSVGSNQLEVRRCRLIAFAPHGPLRPDANDTLITINGRSLHFTGDQGGISGHNGPSALIVGQPYMEIAGLTYGKPGHSFSSDVHQANGVAFAVHVFARLVPIDPQHPYYRQLHDAGHGSSYGRDFNVSSLSEVAGEGAPSSIVPVVGAKPF